MAGDNGNSNNNKGSSKGQSSNAQGDNSSGGKSSANPNVTEFSKINPGQPMSDYEYLKPWGGKKGFMLSYGIKPTPEGFEEARDLIDQMREESGFGKSPYRE
ncbi:hypothetical protein NEUTE1DRAFT_113665 [Neurospora tetrasperma FGSC 2508]|uniref:Uncharacterized protein n=1 Tax=Neurospora tetrasperma (strain FGSC 2508 / ATCC MYA-4615 / P0657) TaxID=510951 RepID=F8MYC4_NEUT8|nr:uncharacterized protein NEUTE1DRAFT_113665 [Neurospora tetrasperma FGSC 2508]EGO51606.1 hypothetical protein NEUTE1DRAFT_113665 [Neurospora tetrasperma FGSC 2508]